MKAHRTDVVRTATDTLVSKERKFNNTNFGDWELSEELDDADLSAINGGALISGPLFSLGNITIGSYNGGYNQTSNNQDGYTSINSTDTSNTNKPRN